MIILSNQLGIIGGDLRIIRLVEILGKENYKIYTYGLDKYNFNNSILKCKELKEMDENCKYIISGIPFSKDGVYLHAPFSNKQININEMFNNIKYKTLIAGAIDKNLKEIVKENKVDVVDLMDIEELTILNAIPTAEGAIQVAMEQTEFTIHNSKCLILGFGRIGKVLAKNLKALGAQVCCVARKEDDLAWIKAYGYKEINLNELEEKLYNKYDIIFNTIPKVILDAKRLELIKDKGTLIIELASIPGGIDYKKAEEYNIKTIKAMGLPGKVAPLTAAKYIKEILKTIIKI